MLFIAAVLLTSLILYAATRLTWGIAKERFKKQLLGARARWEQQSQGAQPPGVLMESFTLGWLNLLVQSLWVPVLEKHVSALATERLQIVLNLVLEKGKAKKPWKYISSVSVEEVTFGLMPPQFQFCFAKFDPQRNYLHFSMDMKYKSLGFQAVLTPLVQQIGMLQPFTVKLEISQLLLNGRLNLGFQLTEEPPGIQGIYYSFASEPEFDIKASPVGLTSIAGELPGLVNSLRSHLLKVISKRLVEPNRRYLDVQKIYNNKHIAKSGGLGGLLRVTVIGARDITPAASHAQPSPPTTTAASSAGAKKQLLEAVAQSGALKHPSFSNSCGPGATSAADADVDAYLELRFGRQVLRTPIVHNSASPLWNWQLDLRLHADIGSGLLDEKLKFKILNAKVIGEPELLSRAEVRVADLNLVVNGEAVPVILPLKHASGCTQGVLQLQAAWLKTIPKKSPFPERAAAQAAAAAAAAVAAATGAGAAQTAAPAAPGSLQHPAARAAQADAAAAANTTSDSSNVHPTVAPAAAAAAAAAAKRPLPAACPPGWDLPDTPTLRSSTTTVSSSMPSATTQNRSPIPSPRGPPYSARASIKGLGIDDANAIHVGPHTDHGMAVVGSNSSGLHHRHPFRIKCPTEGGADFLNRGEPSLSLGVASYSVSHAQGSPKKLLSVIEQAVAEKAGRWSLKLQRHKRALSEAGQHALTRISSFSLAGSMQDRVTQKQADGPATAAAAAAADRGGGGGGCGGADGSSNHRLASATGRPYTSISSRDAASVSYPELPRYVLNLNGGPARGRSPSPSMHSHQQSFNSRISHATDSSNHTSDWLLSPTPSLNGFPTDTPVHAMNVSGPQDMAMNSLEGDASADAHGKSRGSCMATLPDEVPLVSKRTSTNQLNQPGPSNCVGPVSNASSERAVAGTAAAAAAAAAAATRLHRHAAPDNRRPHPPPEIGADAMPSAALSPYSITHPPTAAAGTVAAAVAAATHEPSIPANASVSPLTVQAALSHGPSAFNPLQSLAQVIKIQGLLVQERCAVSVLNQQLAEVQHKYNAVVRLRRLDNERALMEGALFQQHLPTGAMQPVHIRFVRSEGAFYIEPTTKPGNSSSSSSKELRAAKATEGQHRMLPLEDINDIHLGDGMFPSHAGWSGLKILFKGHGAKALKRSGALSSKCFSVVTMTGNDLHLQLPAVGNGRSRDEWAYGFQELVAAQQQQQEVQQGAAQGAATPD